MRFKKPGAVSRRPDGAVEMVVIGRLTPEVLRTCENDGVTRLLLNEELGFEGGIDLLPECNVRELTLVHMGLTDLKPIESMGKLRALHLVTQPDLVVDLQGMSDLIELSGYWQQFSLCVARGRCDGLQELSVLGFDGDDLAALSELRGLKKLTFKDRPTMRDLAGVESLVSLTELRVHDARKLRATTGLEECSELRVLEFDGSTKMRSIDFLPALARLERLVLADCGAIQSLAPIAHIGSLRDLDLSGTTRVADDDLGPLLALQNLMYLAMQSRRSYRPSVDSVLSHLGIE